MRSANPLRLGYVPSSNGHGKSLVHLGSLGGYPSGARCHVCDELSYVGSSGGCSLRHWVSSPHCYLQVQAMGVGLVRCCGYGSALATLLAWFQKCRGMNTCRCPSSVSALVSCTSTYKGGHVYATPMIKCSLLIPPFVHRLLKSC